MALFGIGKKKKAKTAKSGLPDASSDAFREEKEAPKKAEVKAPLAPKQEEKKTTPAPKKQPAKAKTVAREGKDLSGVLRRPRITEKATFQSENGVYVFEVATDASKRDIADAVQHFYKVTPRRVNVTKIRPKKISSRRRGVFGTGSKGKKAYVYLKKGDRIELV